MIAPPTIQDALNSGTTEVQLFAVIPLMQVYTTSGSCMTWVNSLRHLLRGSEWGADAWTHIPATTWGGFCLTLHGVIGAEHWPELLNLLVDATVYRRCLLNVAVEAARG